MKILLSHRFFWPDTAPYAVMLRAIGDALSDAGNEVYVFSSVPSYRAEKTQPKAARSERLGDIYVRRVWVLRDEKSHSIRRIANVAIYCIALFISILVVRPNVVMASTFPPVLAAWMASLAARLIKAKFIYHIQDIHPEVSAYSGGLLGRGILNCVLRWLDNNTLRRSSAIVVLSEDMAHTLEARDLGELPIEIINNFSLGNVVKTNQEPPVELKKMPGKRRVIFAGNLGKFQNLPKMIDGVALLFRKFPDLELLLLGDGAALKELKDKWDKHSQVKFGPFLPFEQAKVLISESDIGILSLLPGLYKVAYPSKLLTYAQLGVPILAIVEAESCLAASITQAGIGAVPAKNTPEAIALALESMLLNDIDKRDVCKWYAKHANSAYVQEKWCKTVQRLADC